MFCCQWTFVMSEANGSCSLTSCDCLLVQNLTTHNSNTPDANTHTPQYTGAEPMIFLPKSTDSRACHLHISDVHSPIHFIPPYDMYLALADHPPASSTASTAASESSTAASTTGQRLNRPIVKGPRAPESITDLRSSYQNQHLGKRSVDRPCLDFKGNAVSHKTLMAKSL